MTFFVARGLGLVVLRDAFNKRLPGRFRATANSLASFGFRAAFAVTGPFVGWALDLWGMDVTLALLAVVSLVIFATLLLPLTLAVRTAATDAVEPAASVNAGTRRPIPWIGLLLRAVQALPRSAAFILSRLAAGHVVSRS